MTKQTWVDSFFVPPAPTNLLDATDLVAQFDLVDESWRHLVEDWHLNGAGSELVYELFRRGFLNRLQVMPKMPLRALNMTSLASVKVVIIGDEPSAVGNVADGLAFSAPIGRHYSDAIRAIADELERDIGFKDHGLADLNHWASRGVLLLNCVLTVEHQKPRTHVGLGWEDLTDRVIRTAAEHPTPKAFLLWGRAAKTKAPLIQSAGNRHLVLECSAPRLAYKISAGGFLGCGHFSQAADFLKAHGSQVDWLRA